MPGTQKVTRSRSGRRQGYLHVASFFAVATLLIAGCSKIPTPSMPSESSATSVASRPAAAGSSALKQIDQSALQTMMNRTAKERF
jgi:hypothetical protein